MIKLTRIASTSIPIELLLEADPDTCAIEQYLHQAHCFAITENDSVLAACVCKPTSDTECELMNIAVWPSQQGRKLGSQLLNFTIEELKKEGFKKVSLGTGTFGHQLTFYQRAGFRVIRVECDYFLEHYPEPIFENGIQHKDRLWLALDLMSYRILKR